MSTKPKVVQRLVGVAAVFGAAIAGPTIDGVRDASAEPSASASDAKVGNPLILTSDPRSQYLLHLANVTRDKAVSRSYLRQLADRNPAHGDFYASSLFFAATEMSGSGYHAFVPTHVVNRSMAEEAIQRWKQTGTARGMETAASCLTAIGIDAFKNGNRALGQRYFKDARQSMAKVFDPGYPETTQQNDRGYRYWNQAAILAAQASWDPTQGGPAVEAALNYDAYLHRYGISEDRGNATQVLAAYVQDTTTGALPPGTSIVDYKPNGPLPTPEQVKVIALGVSPTREFSPLGH